MSHTVRWLGRGVVVVMVLVVGIVMGMVLTTSKSSMNSPYGLIEAGSVTEDNQFALSDDRVVATTAVPPSQETEFDASTVASGQASATTTDQRLIKTAALDIVVNKTPEAVTQISSLAKAQGGFVLSASTVTKSDGTLGATVSIRVPADTFEATLTQLKDSAQLVEAEDVSGTDVTEEYVDLQARLSNSQALESNYVGILAKATTVEDTLKVTKALSTVREEIETLQGRLKYLNNRTDYSTISVTVRERPAIGSSVAEKFDLELEFQTALQALVRAGQAVLVTVIWVLVFGLPLVGVVVVLWGVVRLIKRRHAGPAATSTKHN